MAVIMTIWDKDITNYNSVAKESFLKGDYDPRVIEVDKPRLK